MDKKLVGTKEYQIRTYFKNKSISFAKVDAPYGGLHNMAPNYPIVLNGITIFSSEHLYQCLRFPNHPEIQEKVLAPKSPMTSKMIMKEHLDYSRTDWDAVKIPIMKWCLMMKLLQNWEQFGNLILSTDSKEVVEYSKKDDFWGAMPSGYNLVGVNALGRLIMGIREDIPKMQGNSYILKEPNVINCLFLGNPITAFKVDFLPIISK